MISIHEHHQEKIVNFFIALNLIITIYFYFLSNFPIFKYSDYKSVILVFSINVSFEFKIQILFFGLIYQLAKIQKNIYLYSLLSFFFETFAISAI